LFLSATCSTCCTHRSLHALLYVHQQCTKSFLFGNEQKAPKHPDIWLQRRMTIRAQTAVVWPMPDLSDEFVADTQEACARIIAKTTHSDVQVAASATRMSADVITRCATRAACVCACLCLAHDLPGHAVRLWSVKSFVEIGHHPLFFLCLCVNVA